MFDIGFSEIVVIFGLALIVLGPSRLPKIVQTLGRWAGRARAMARQFRDQLEQEANQLKADVDLEQPLRGERRPPQPDAAPVATGAPASGATENHPATEQPPPAPRAAQSEDPRHDAPPS